MSKIVAERPSRRLDGRSTERTHLFVSAVLYAETGSSPAKVRNLSEKGAMVEASVLPEPGSAIRLCRGSLTVSGRVAWTQGNKAGLRFDSGVVVADWLPRGPGFHQARVDEIVDQIRTGNALPGSAPEGEVNHPLSSSLELQAVARTLERIAAEFIADMDVVKRHGWKLQELEGAAQTVRRLAISASERR